MAMSVTPTDQNEAKMATTVSQKTSKAAELDKWVASPTTNKPLQRKLQPALMMFTPPADLCGFLRAYVMTKLRNNNCGIRLSGIKSAIFDARLFHQSLHLAAGYGNFTFSLQVPFTCGSWRPVMEHFTELDVPLEYAVLYMLHSSRQSIFAITEGDLSPAVASWAKRVATRVKNIQSLESLLVYGSLTRANDIGNVFRRKVARMYENYVGQPVWDEGPTYLDLIFAQLIPTYKSGAIPKVPKMGPLLLEVLGTKAHKLLCRYYDEAGVCMAWENKPTGYNVVSL